MDLLRGVRVFASLTDAQRRQVARLMERRTLLRGHTLHEEGDEADSLALLTEGRLAVQAQVGEVIVSVGTIYPGESVGAMTMLVPGIQETRVTAEVMGTVCILSHAAFRQLEARDHALGQALRRGVICEVSRWLREVDARIDDELKRRGAVPISMRMPPDPAPMPKSPVTLRNIPMLADFPKSEIERLIEVAPPRAAKRGVILAEEGQESGCHIVVRGKVDLLRKVSGTRRFIARLSDGAVVGPQTLIEPEPSTARVLVRQRSVIMSLAPEAFQAALANDEPFARRLYECVVEAGIRQYWGATKKLVALLVDAPSLNVAVASRPKAVRASRAVIQARGDAAKTLDDSKDPKGLNTAMLQHLRVATNEWGLDLDFKNRC